MKAFTVIGCNLRYSGCSTLSQLTKFWSAYLQADSHLIEVAKSFNTNICVLPLCKSAAQHSQSIHNLAEGTGHQQEDSSHQPLALARPSNQLGLKLPSSSATELHVSPDTPPIRDVSCATSKSTGSQLVFHAHMASTTKLAMIAARRAAATSQESPDAADAVTPQLPAKRSRLGLQRQTGSNKRTKQELTDHAEQQQKQYAAVTRDLQPLTLDQQILVGIMSGLMQLQAQCSSKYCMQISKDQAIKLDIETPLVQLRVISRFVSAFASVAPLEQHLQEARDFIDRQSGSRWLTDRCSNASHHILSPAAIEVHKELHSRGVLDARSVPGKAARLPTELQIGYLLCLGGHAEPASLADFATEALQHILKLVRQAIQQDCQHGGRLQVMSSSLQHSTSLTSVLNRTHLAQRHTAAQRQFGSHCETRTHSPDRAAAAVGAGVSAMQPLDIRDIYRRVQTALVHLGRLKSILPDSHVLDCLQQEPVVNQLLVLSHFCAYTTRQQCPTRLLEELSSTLYMRGTVVSRAILCNMRYIPDRPVRGMFAAARWAKVFDIQDVQRTCEAAIASLPGSLQHMAACYAIGITMSESDCTKAVRVLHQRTTQMHELLQQV